MYVPISPQWNGLMPPVVQLYTRAALGLQGGEQGHNNTKKNTHLRVINYGAIKVLFTLRHADL